jgi:RNA polymerase II subunit A-like phosphatase
MKESIQAITVPCERYPIQILRWKVQVNTKVTKDQVLGIYEYLETVEETQTTKRAEIRVPYEGHIESLVGIDHVCYAHEEALGFIKEDCSHSVQLHGLCALCGLDLSISDYIGSDTQRVSINLTHDSKGVMISHKEAQRIESLTTERLLKQKKLSLLLDLDQTVVHATVDSTVKEWLENPNNPNFPALDEVHQFSLNESPTIYYLKLRPGTRKLLKKLHKKYEVLAINPDAYLYHGNKSIRA